MKRLAILAAMAWALASTTAASAAGRTFDFDDACEPFALQIPPPPYQRPALKFPSAELERDAEGWVALLANVDENGAVRDVVITDSFGGAGFRDAARVAVSQWRYQPRVVNGKTVATYGLHIDVRFVIEPDRGAASTHEFFLATKRFNSLWGTDKAAAAAVLEEARSLPLQTRDRAILSVSLALAAKANSDVPRALYFLRHATAGNMQAALGKGYAATIRWRIELEATEGHLKKALCLHRWNRQLLNDNPSANDTTPALIAATTVRMNSPAPLTVTGHVFGAAENELGPMWAHELSRPSFSLAAAGNISSARLVCPSSSQERPASQAVRWRVPDETEACTLYVFGTPGATVQLTEEW